MWYIVVAKGVLEMVLKCVSIGLSCFALGFSIAGLLYNCVFKK